MSGWLVLVAVTALVVVGAGCGATLLRLTDPLDWTLAAGTLAACQVLLSSLVVGVIAERYDPSSLAAANAAWSGLVVALRVRLPPGAPGARAAIAAARRAAASLEPWQRIVGLLAVAALAWRALLALLLPPFGFDALTYHLTAVAAWVQSGHIGVNPYSVCCARYPSDTEVVHAWPAVLMHRDTLVDAPQIGFALVGAAAVASIARQAGARASSAVAAASLFLLTPIVLVQANVGYVDVAFASMLLACVAFAARFLEGAGLAPGAGGSHPPRLALVLLAGLAAGFVLGTKTNGILAAGVVGLFVLGRIAVAAARGRIPTSTALSAIGAFTGAVLAVGGWWYVRNWAEVANPVWPIDVHAFGHGVFAGRRQLTELLTVPPGGNRFWLIEVARSWYQDLALWTRTDYSYEERDGGLGAIWSWLGWVCLAWLAVVALRRRRAFALDVLAPLTVLFAAQPYRWWSRFTVYVAALGAVAIAVAAAHAAGRVRLVLTRLTVALAVVSVVLCTWKVDPAGFGHQLRATEVLELVGHPGRERSVGTLFYDEYAWLDRVPDEATIGVESLAPSIRFLYPLFGPELRRHVVLFFPGGQGSVERRLGTGRPTFLAVEVGGAYDRWARARPTELRPTFTERGVRVYRRAP